MLIKYWLEVSNEEQERRFEARINDPIRQWKLSPMDLPSRSRWYDYSRARDEMLKATDTKHAPGTSCGPTTRSEPRLNCISHLLGQIPYKTLPQEKIKLPKRSNKRRLRRSSLAKRSRIRARKILIRNSELCQLFAVDQSGAEWTCQAKMATWLEATQQAFAGADLREVFRYAQNVSRGTGSASSNHTPC